MLTATSYTRDQHVIAGLMYLACLMQPGTGGLQTLEYYKAREMMGYPLVRCEDRPESLPEQTVRTSAEDLAHVRAFLRPAIADLANALGVSRQALYDWQAGKPVSVENAARLADLGRAADVLAAGGLPASAQLIRRPIQSGKTLLDVVREGGPAEEAAVMLAKLVRREHEQRDRLATKLSSRPRRTVGGGDFGSPVLDEVA